MAAGSRARGLWACAILLLLGLWGVPVGAGELAPHRAVIYSAPEVLLPRLRGQTGDLDWELVLSSDTPPSEDAVRAAVAKGRAESAELVLWFERVSGGGWQVYSVDVEREDLLSRRVSLPDSGDMDESAAAEAAALVVRSILSSMSSGGRLGVVAKPAEPSGEAPPSAAGNSTQDNSPRARVPTPSPEPGQPSEPGEPVAALAMALWLHAGWQIAEDSNELFVVQGPEAGAGVVSQRWLFGLRGSYGLRRALTDSLTTLRLTRFDLAATLGYRFWERGPWAFEAAVRAGLAGYRRRTEARRPEVQAAPGVTVLSPIVSADAAARAALSPRHPVSLVMTLGLDVLPRAPVLNYAGPEATVERARIWPAQPRLSLAIEVRPRIF